MFRATSARRGVRRWGSVGLLSILGVAAAFPETMADAKPETQPHALFVWAGDADKRANDFLVTIDADPASPTYGRFLSGLDSGYPSVLPHHTEYSMPPGGILFANDHYGGRTFLFDLRDPLKPALVTSFDDMAGFEHPHSFLRLPNGHVLASFQHRRHRMGSALAGESGGLVEIDDRGAVVRSAGNADPAFAGAQLTPYSLAVLPEIDRVVSTNSSMHLDHIFSGATYQVWRLSDLKLLTTAYFDVGDNRYAHIGPQEVRRGPDGSVFVQTLSCGLERITGVETATPVAKLVHTFPGNWCGVPTVVGRFLVMSVPEIHGFVSLDISDGAHPREVSSVKVSDTFVPHWTSWDPVTRRIVAPPNRPDDNRLYLLRLDPESGALSVDESFRDVDGKPGVSFAARDWPHGFRGTAAPHGAVFSR